MSNLPDDYGVESSESAADLQHEAERVVPVEGHAIMRYLVVLFAAAFILLLMSYMMQRRSNDETISGLAASSVSAMKSVENMLLENETLEAQTQELEARVAELEAELAEAAEAVKAGNELSEQWFEQRETIYTLDLLRILERTIADKDYETARAVITAMESVLNYLPDYPLHGFEGDYGGSPLERYQELLKLLK